MQYVEFTAIAYDGEEIRLRKTWPIDPQKAKHTPPVYTCTGFQRPVEVVSEGRFRVDGKVYVWQPHQWPDERLEPRRVERHGDLPDSAKKSGAT